MLLSFYPFYFYIGNRYKRGKEDLWLKSYVSGDVGFGFYLRNISREKWTKIKMNQFGQNEKIYYEISRDGVSQLLKENTTPTEFYDLKFWCSDKFRSVAPNMKVRNVKHKHQTTCNFNPSTTCLDECIDLNFRTL